MLVDARHAQCGTPLNAHLLPGDKIAVDQLGDGTIILKKIEEQVILAATEKSEIGIMQAAQG